MKTEEVKQLFEQFEQTAMLHKMETFGNRKLHLHRLIFAEAKC